MDTDQHTNKFLRIIDHKCTYKSVQIQLINIRTNLYRYRYIHKFTYTLIPSFSAN